MVDDTHDDLTARPIQQPTHPVPDTQPNWSEENDPEVLPPPIDDEGQILLQDLLQDEDPDAANEVTVVEGGIEPLEAPADTNEIDVIGDDTYDALDAPEEDPAYFPPTDPVVTRNDQGDDETLNGFSPTAMDGIIPARSTLDGLPGDEALADAVSAALRADALTTDLTIDVSVEQGVARLRGTVPTLMDAENAEAVAARAPGIDEVDEELDIAQM